MAAGASQSEAHDLEQTGIPALLFKLLSQRFTGELRIAPEDGVTGSVGFAGGLPRWCDADVPNTRLGDLLVEQEAITRPKLKRAMAVGGATDGERLGEMLVARGDVDPQAVAAALRIQCRRRLVAMCGYDRGRALSTAETSTELHGFPEAGVLPIVREGIREQFTGEQLASGLRPIMGHPFCASPALEKYAPHFEFSNVELTGIAALPTTGGITFDEWVADSGLEVDAAKRLLYCLYVCKMLAGEGGASASTSHVRSVSASASDVRGQIAAESSSAAPRPRRRRPPMSGDGVALARQISERWSEDRDPYRLLSIDDDADLAAIDKAVREYKTRLGVPGDRRVDPAVEAAASTLDEAHEAARVRRRERCEEVGPGLLLTEKWRDATPVFEDLLRFKKGHVPTRVALAWIRFHTSTRTGREAQRACDALDLLIGEAPELADAHYYRGYMLLELEKEKLALLAFEKAAELDPRNTDASRQARAVRSGKAPQRAAARKSKAAASSSLAPLEVKSGRSRARIRYWSGPWPAIWVVTGALVTALIAAQIVLRLDMDF